MSEFKKCSSCGKTWSTLVDFINDKTLKVNGYQANITSVGDGYLMFTHIVPNCNSTIMIPVEKFSTLYKKELDKVKMKTHDECPNYCESGESLDLCNVPVCEGFFVRELIHFLKHRHDE